MVTPAFHYLVEQFAKGSDAGMCGIGRMVRGDFLGRQEP